MPPITDENTVNDFTRVKTGDMTEVRPNIWAGHYRGSFECTPSKTGDNSKSPGMPMLKIKFTVEEALDEGREEEVGRSSQIQVIFNDSSAAGANFQRIRVKNLTEGYDLPPCDTSSLEEGSWDSLKPWVDALESQVRDAWVTNPPDRTTGEPQTEIHAMDPKKAATKPTAAGKELDDTAAGEDAPDGNGGARKGGRKGRRG